MFDVLYISTLYFCCTIYLFWGTAYSARPGLRELLLFDLLYIMLMRCDLFVLGAPYYSRPSLRIRLAQTPFALFF